jgi:hypothetical protein
MRDHVSGPGIHSQRSLRFINIAQIDSLESKVYHGSELQQALLGDYHLVQANVQRHHKQGLPHLENHQPKNETV